MALIMEIVRAIRNVRAEYSVKPGQALSAAIAAGDRAELLRAEAETLCTLARLEPAQLAVAAQLAAPAGALTLVVGGTTVYLPLSELVDLAAERARLAKELAEMETLAARSEQLLQGPFAQRAPANVVQREQEKLAQLQEQAGRLRERLRDLEV
jgi:valyl-tRNA synthetase